MNPVSPTSGLSRRAVLAGAALLPVSACAAPRQNQAATTPSQPAAPPPAAPVADPTFQPPDNASFKAYVQFVKGEARRNGISQATLDRAFANVHMNQRAIDLDRHQPEFNLTWEQYRSRIVSPTRIARGRELYGRNRALMDAVYQRYGVPPGILIGIWGLESNYGQATGGFNVIEGLTTLAWEGRRRAFFQSELMDALRILDRGDITPEKMTGSYAGAMGQTQFMPDSFLKYAVDYSGTGRRDIWNDLGDVFGSTANYLAREGWTSSLPWGLPVTIPPTLDVANTGRDHRRSVAEWERLGVRATNGLMPAGDSQAAVILPGGPNSEAFLACHPNFLAIRRYNPSDFYCISVGLIGDAVTA